jgi:hypothetical protein
LEAKAAVPIKRAASAAQVDRLFMAFLPGKLEGVSLSKKLSPNLGKAFPNDCSADGERRQGRE